MSRLVIEELNQPSGLFNVTRDDFHDHRGKFSKLYTRNQFSSSCDFSLQEVSLSHTKARGTVRGIHFQLEPKTEAKYICCLKGSIFDVAVDLRRNSKSYGEHHSTVISAQKNNGLIIGKGFGHAFQTLTDDVELLYFHSEAYSPDLDAGLNPLDPDLHIDWPLPVENLSNRDKSLPSLRNFAGILI